MWLDKCLKSPVSEDSSKGNMVNGPKYVEICMTAALPYLLIAVKAIDFQKVSVSDMENLSKLFPNTLSADGKYSLLNGDNLTQPIQMQVSRKRKNFLVFFLHF